MARQALGLVLSRPLEYPLKSCNSLYRMKVLKLLQNALKSREDWWEAVETYVLAGAKLDHMLPAKPKAKDLLDALEVVNGWQTTRLALSLYLQKRGPLQEVKDSLGLLEEYKDPVSEAEFLRELKELSLAEFLGLVT